MAKDIVMPKMGYDMTEGKLLRWIKHEGDTINKGEAIAEIETDKVNIEVEAFDSGVLQRVLVQPMISGLGEVLIGARQGRRAADEVTLFESLGLAVEDLAAAAFVVAAAREQGVGTAVTF